MKRLFVSFLYDDAGVTAIEYGLVAALVGLVIISAVHSVGEQLKTTFRTVASSL